MLLVVLNKMLRKRHLKDLNYEQFDSNMKTVCDNCSAQYVVEHDLFRRLYRTILFILW